MIRSSGTEILTEITDPLLSNELISRRCRIDCESDDLAAICLAAERALMAKFEICFRPLELLTLFEAVDDRRRLAIPYKPFIEVVHMSQDIGYKLINSWRSQAILRLDAPLTGDIEVRYIAGKLTEDMTNALLMMISHMYERYSATGDVTVYEIPMGVTYLLSNYRSQVYY